MAQQTVRFFPIKKEIVILSRAVYFLEPIVYSERPYGTIIALSSNSFYLTEGSSERRERVRVKERKNLEAFQMQRALL